MPNRKTTCRNSTPRRRRHISIVGKGSAVVVETIVVIVIIVVIISKTILIMAIRRTKGTIRVALVTRVVVNIAVRRTTADALIKLGFDLASVRSSTKRVGKKRAKSLREHVELGVRGGDSEGTLNDVVTIVVIQ